MLLNKWSQGDKSVERELFDLIYPSIHKITHNQVSSFAKGLSDTTDILHDVFFKLQKNNLVNWKSRGHFYASCAMIIRRILIDHHRKINSQKAGGANPHTSLDDVTSIIVNSYSFDFDFIEFDRLLSHLEKIDEQASNIVKLRYFIGLTKNEIAQMTGISISQVSRDWNFAKCWLHDKLNHQTES